MMVTVDVRRPSADRRSRATRRVRNLSCAGLLALAALGISGCAATRNELGLSDGLCYVSLPSANAAVHGKGSLLGMRLRRVSDIRAVHPLSPIPEMRMGVNAGTRLCLVAFRGQFMSSDVQQPHGRPSGRVAVVVLTYPGNRLLGTVILRRPPIQFGHSHPL